MSKLLTHILDFLFPLSADEKLLRNTSTENFINFYDPRIVSETIVLSDYQTSVVKAAVTENKYHYNQSAATLLAALIAKWLEGKEGKYIFVPIPLGKDRFRTRGFNQVERILRQINPVVEIQSDWLQRSKETIAQTTLSKPERRENMAHAFVSGYQTLPTESGATVVIVDDVLTTGATMEAARAALAPHLPADATLVCLALAH